MAFLLDEMNGCLKKALPYYNKTKTASML